MARLSRAEAGNSTTATGQFAVRKTVPHSEVTECRLLYSNTLDAGRFGAMFSDGRSFTMLNRQGSVATWTSVLGIGGIRVSGRDVLVSWIRLVALIFHLFVTLTRPPTYTACVRWCAEIRAIGSQWKGSNRSERRSRLTRIISSEMRMTRFASWILRDVKGQIWMVIGFLVGTTLTFSRYSDVKVASFPQSYWRASPSMRCIVRWGYRNL